MLRCLELPVACRLAKPIRAATNPPFGTSSPRNRSPIFAKTAPEVPGKEPARRPGGNVQSNNVQRFREALMMSKAELARKSGLSTLTIDRVEAGRPCRLDTKRKILQALQLRIDDHDRVFGDLRQEIRPVASRDAHRVS